MFCPGNQTFQTRRGGEVYVCAENVFVFNYSNEKSLNFKIKICIYRFEVGFFP